MPELSVPQTQLLRWIIALPAAILAAGLAQLVFYPVTWRLAESISGDIDATIWSAKSMTSVFIGAAFVSAAMLMAPRKKRAVGLACIGVVAIWGTRLAIQGPTLWGLIMGGLGLIGAVAALVCFPVVEYGWKIWAGISEQLGHSCLLRAFGTIPDQDRSFRQKMVSSRCSRGSPSRTVIRVPDGDNDIG